ncbi:Crp/Fnr family transcriptional regulator [Marinoscillum sp. 108]|uniref:Crp/Fnr family transcriptional regulator n=1 Tax=Marinoscillum sp. 108 TaxID=2653151 RepID=UPI0012EF89AC|nr:Crp/Fnr family transcriptional regulator [Marinoscillum sp. 108]VXD11280.1 cAMP-binding domain of CRP or a regulatory subunit of cAMP-dependent protein kinases [Marinoscillum sp. 108]
MDKLINYLLEFGQLNQQQINLIKRKAQVLELKKGDYFSEAGKIPRQVTFIEEGILRVCYYNSKGDEITKYFVDENNFAVDINSFTQKIPSSEYVQAVVYCTLLVFSTESLNDLSATIIQWDGIINKITEKALVEKVNKLSPMLAEDATTRYLNFLEKFPNLANRVPLSYLASYLGITQSSLSRIRKGI